MLILDTFLPCVVEIASRGLVILLRFAREYDNEQHARALR